MQLIAHLNKNTHARVPFQKLESPKGDYYLSNYEHLKYKERIDFITACVLFPSMHRNLTILSHETPHLANEFENLNNCLSMGIDELLGNETENYGRWVEFSKDCNALPVKSPDLNVLATADIQEIANNYYFSIPFLHALKSKFGKNAFLNFKFVEIQIDEDNAFTTLAFKITESIVPTNGNHVFDMSYKPPYGGALGFINEANARNIS